MNVIQKMQLLLIVVCLLAINTVFAEEAPRPNIIILVDDLGYADVGFNGSKDIITPHLDQLAAQGTTFSSAYVPHPCGPSRVSLMSVCVEVVGK